MACLFVGLFFSMSQGQEKDRLILAGMVAEGEEPLADAVVGLYEGDRPVKTVQTDQRGDFQLEMQLGKSYTIEFSKQDYVAKKISVNSSVPEGQGGKWEAEFSIGLFKMYPGLDVSALDDPVTRILYKENERGFGYDEMYTRKMMAKIDKIMEQLARLKEKAYRRLIRKGDELFDDKKYEECIGYYQKALDQRPDDRYPKKQIERAREMMDEIKERQTLYQSAVARADRLFQQKHFEKARETYYEALDYDPGKEYPEKQIARIDRLIKQKQQEQQRQQAQYNQLVDQADQLYEDNQLAAARDKYKQALTVVNGKDHPQERIEEIDEQIRREEAKEQRYKDLIFQADKAFTAGKLEDATDYYQDALEIQDRSYPHQQLSRIDSMKQARQARQEQYDSFVTAGDRAFRDEAYNRAREAYQSALEIRSGASHPTQQLDRIDQILNKRRLREEQYQAALDKADQYFEEKKYERAVGAYRQALDIKPDQSYPSQQIQEIESILQDRKALNEQYRDLIGRADRAFEKETYPRARDLYQQALDIKAGKEYPQDQIARIDLILEKRRMREQAAEAYRQKIRVADSTFDAGSLEKAIRRYEEALEMRPNKEYPKKQIERIEQILLEKRQNAARQQALQQAYQQAVDNGDEAFDKEAYQESREYYQKALSLISGKQHPQDQIERIDQILEERRLTLQKYQQAVERADRLFDGQSYQEALKAYQQADSIKPDETYPNVQIGKINNILANLEAKDQRRKALEEQYRQTIQKADELFDAEDYQQARVAYKRASEIRPGESYPVERMEAIDQIFEQRRLEKERAYRQAVEKADALFAEEKYSQAIGRYEQARTIRPGADYPPGQIRKIKNRMARLERQEQEQQRRDSLYSAAISKADAFYDEYAYYNAKAFYEKALQYKPGEEYPKNKIRLCEENIRLFEESEPVAEKTEKEAEPEKQPVGGSGSGLPPEEFDSKKQQDAYLSKLAREYPEGVTREHYEEGKRTITRVIVNYDGVATDYRKVKHSWGGTFYFRNGRSISAAVFRLETRER
jgi:tetratricopeptide (TPR) repeat protein